MILRLYGLLCIFLSQLALAQEVPKQDFEPFSFIELFTSQGCGSCASADALVSDVIDDAEKSGQNIYVLSFHIDYWNPLGWEDIYSNAKYAEYQRKYAHIMKIRTIYSPQMIINGSREIAGVDKKLLNMAINQSLYSKPTAGFLKLESIVSQDEAPVVKYTLSGDTAGCRINFALISKKEVTAIKAGENKGRKLKGENIVRQFISVNARQQGQVTFEKTPLPEKENMQIIVYIQQINDMRIIGAAIAPF